jgi:hypothetical protein
MTRDQDHLKIQKKSNFTASVSNFILKNKICNELEEQMLK